VGNPKLDFEQSTIVVPLFRQPPPMSETQKTLAIVASLSKPPAPPTIDEVPILIEVLAKDLEHLWPDDPALDPQRREAPPEDLGENASLVAPDEDARLSAIRAAIKDGDFPGKTCSHAQFARTIARACGATTKTRGFGERTITNMARNVRAENAEK
jgi:hypothetical protein